MKRLKRTIVVYASISLFVMIGGFVYLLFGHGITSAYMGHAYFFPLLMGMGFNLLLLPVQHRFPFTGTVGYRLYSNAYNAGVATLTTCSILSGVIEIAGADSAFIAVMWVMGALGILAGLMILGISLVQVSKAMRRRNSRRRWN